MTEMQNATIGGIIWTAAVISLAFAVYKIARARILVWLSTPVVVQDDNGQDGVEDILDHSDILLKRAEHLAALATRTAAVLVAITLVAVSILLVKTGSFADGLAQAVAKIGGAG